MADTQGIVLFRDNYEVVRDVLSWEQQGILLGSLFDGQYSGEDPVVKMAFNIFYAAIQRSNEKYESKKETNRQNARKKWEKDRETRRKAEAYDDIQSHPVASGRIRSDASLTQTGADADTHTRPSSTNLDQLREVLHQRGATVTEIDDAMASCEGKDISDPLAYMWKVIENSRKKAKKILPAQNYSQRDYEQVQADIERAQSEHVLAALAAYREAGSG